MTSLKFFRKVRLTEIQYWQIKPSEKGTHTNKLMML